MEFGVVSSLIGYRRRRRVLAKRTRIQFKQQRAMIKAMMNLQKVTIDEVIGITETAQ